MAELISIDEARRRVLAAARTLPTEIVGIKEAFHRYLAEDVLAAVDVPPFSSSAMDGYAVRAASRGQELQVTGESRAGSPSDDPLSEGAAIRISTGAQVPAGAAAVVRQEDVDRRDGTIVLRCEVRPGDNLRPAGDVIRTGEKALGRGRRVGAPELGVAVAAGAARLRVATRPRVAALCTGDELREPGQRLDPGQIYNSNAPMLTALAEQAGALATHAGLLPDDQRATEDGLEEALVSADVVVVSGGVSVGPHDHVKPSLAALGVDEIFWGVSLQPGKPTWFGARENKLVFGLPGNPVSAAVTFALFVGPALAALQGSSSPLPARGQARSGREIRRNPTREQALRVTLEAREGALLVVPTGPQGSHHITSLLGADALAFIPPGEGSLQAGATVSVELLPQSR